MVTLITLCLGYYAFASDVIWNNSVESHAINICIDINQAIHHKNNTLLPTVECTERLDIKNEDECKQHIEDFYLTKLDNDNKYKVKLGDKTKNLKKFIEVNMRRRQASETSFLVTINCISIILIVHLLL